MGMKGFKNVNIFAGKDHIIKSGYIEFENGKISSVGHANDRPSGSYLVDMDGRWLLPGLVDCNTHVTLPDGGQSYSEIGHYSDALIGAIGCKNIASMVQGGVTLIRDIGGIRYIDILLRDGIRSGQFLGPTMLASGKVICITGGHASEFACLADGETEMVSAVRKQFAAGSNYIKLVISGGVLSPNSDPKAVHMTYEEVSAAVNEAHRLCLKVAAHCQNIESVRIALKAGVDTIEHGVELDGFVIEEMAKKNTALVPTLSPLIKILQKGAEYIPQNILDKCKRMEDMHRTSFQMAVDGGVKTLMGSDSGTPYNYHGSSREEIVYMVRNGMKISDALHAATAAPAEFLGFPNKGRLEAGFDADFIIANGEIIDNSEQMLDSRFIEAVYKDGTCLFSASYLDW